MKKKDVYSVIQKYIETLIMPRFPELTGFEIEKSHRRIIPSLGKKGHPIDIKFYFTELDEERRKKLRRDMLQMNRYLSIPHEFHTEHYLDGLDTW